MARLFWKFFSVLTRMVLSLRYRIEVKGLEKLNGERLARKGGILFLPNHPAHMDPLFLFLLLWPRFAMRPLVIEYIYRQGWMKLFMKLVGALPIPNFETSVNQVKIKKAEKVIGEIADGLKRGENFLLYPAGKLKSTGKEIIGGASAAHALLQECPETNVVLIRTTGLWGSSFSRAITGRSPDLKKTLAHGIGAALKNGLFFLPRRSVKIEIEVEPAELPRGGEKLAFNRALEQWYNQYEDDKGQVSEKEPLKLVSYRFWKHVVPEVYKPRQRVGEGGAAISPEIREKIYAEIARIVEKPNLAVKPEMHLAFDLGMDSLQIAELIIFIGQHFEVEELHPEDLETVQSVLEVAEGARAAEQPRHQVVQQRWPQEDKRPVPLLPLGRTIPEAFLNSCDRMGSAIACGDDLIGVFTYKKMKRSALVLSEHFRRMPQERIGVLLPASVGAFIVILAIQFAGKTPVMLNWTLGPRYLEDMIKTAQAGAVITSWRFLERLSHVDFGSLTDMIQLLEDIRESLTLKEKLRGALRSLFGAKSIMLTLGLNRLDENDPAVILFTSGTEASPKGVPLSHKNILSNLRAGMQCIELKGTDVVYGILPPFHSFGFSVAGLFAFLCGTKIAFYPDPTDSFALAEGVERWKITVFCSAPSFLKGLLQAAKKGQLDSIRYFIAGAEKSPPELYQRVAQLGTNAHIIEGYGITECSPIITINRPNLPPRGVGMVLPDLDVCTIHPETQKLLPPHVEGELCVRGPSVFKGYLGSPRNPFIEIEGQEWYRTGDIGRIDEDGYLILSGRLKRFTKIGGEMISLSAVEEVLRTELIRQNQIDADAPSLAVCADEQTDGKQPQLVLFTTLPLEKDAINEILRQSGLSRLVKISNIKKIEEIPLLGTGKTDYRTLQTRIA